MEYHVVVDLFVFDHMYTVLLLADYASYLNVC